MLPQTVKTLQDWLVFTLDKYGGWAAALNQPKSHDGYVDGYPIAAKTGTAQISRVTPGYCDGTNGESLYDCNTRKGIYEHNYIGFGPVGDAYKGQPKFLVLLKLSEARIGEPMNLSIDTLGPYFSDIFQYTLQYYGVPKTPGR